MSFHSVINSVVCYSDVTIANSAGRLEVPEPYFGNQCHRRRWVCGFMACGQYFGSGHEEEWVAGFFNIARLCFTLWRAHTAHSLVSCPPGPITGLTDRQRGGRRAGDKGLTDRGHYGAQLPGKITQDSAHLLLLFFSEKYMFGPA